MNEVTKAADQDGIRKTVQPLGVLMHTFNPILRRPRQKLPEFQASQGHSETWKEKNIHQHT